MENSRTWVAAGMAPVFPQKDAGGAPEAVEVGVGVGVGVGPAPEPVV
jgi:hypothetical protein